MKSPTGWDGNSDGSGFSALPGGARVFSWEELASFDSVGSKAYFWSSSPSVSDWSAWYRALSSGNDHVDRSSDSIQWFGFAVRCLKDE